MNNFKTQNPKSNINHPKLSINHSSFSIQNSLHSSALAYSITFLLIIGLLCSGVIFITSVNKRLEYNYTMKEHLVMDNYLSLLVGAKMKDHTNRTIIHPAGDTSKIVTKPWGVFKMVVAETFHKGKKQVKSALIGYEIKDNLPSLYMVDNNQPLKLAGSTKIEGVAYLPERGVEHAYISGKNYTGTKLIYGTTKKSDRFLPKLKEVYRNITFETLNKNCQKVEQIHKDSSYSFKEKTSLFTSITSINLQNDIRGNIIIHSFDAIYVSSNSYLENVILIAPKITFEKNFKGSCQAIAHQSIICEENVSLNYPSTLLLNEREFNVSDISNEIVLAENTKVLGGILLVAQNSNFRKPICLKQSAKSIIAGLVYNQGSSEIMGTISGHLYTQALNLKTGGGEYSNLLMDCKISADLLPKDFIIPDWLEEEKVGDGRIIMSF